MKFENNFSVFLKVSPGNNKIKSTKKTTAEKGNNVYFVRLG